MCRTLPSPPGPPPSGLTSPHHKIIPSHQVPSTRSHPAPTALFSLSDMAQRTSASMMMLQTMEDPAPPGPAPSAFRPAPSALRPTQPRPLYLSGSARRQKSG